MFIRALLRSKLYYKIARKKLDKFSRDLFYDSGLKKRPPSVLLYKYSAKERTGMNTQYIYRDVLLPK